MPELPEVEALAAYLREHAVGRTVSRLELASASALKTYQPGPEALSGRTVTGVARHGKFLDLDMDGIHLVTHLSRTGWLRWQEAMRAAPIRPGRGPLALRLRFTGGVGFDLTEQGTRKRLAAYLVTDPADVPGIARLGTDALAADVVRFADLTRGETRRLKTVLTDQRVIAGIGNAYSDDILHAARLSPFATPARLTEAQVADLHEATGRVLREAVAHLVRDRAPKASDRRTRIHGRTGEPCPVCGDTVREVSYADTSFQYCPTCQTGGRVLADRRLSRLLR